MEEPKRFKKVCTIFTTAPFPLLEEFSLLFWFWSWFTALLFISFFHRNRASNPISEGLYNLFSYPFKFILQAYSVIYALLSWATNNYYITENKIVHCKGILNIDEEIYDISSLRSVKSHQNIIGRIFNYGNVIVEVFASGGYHKNILLMGIASPKKIRKNLKRILEKNKKPSPPRVIIPKKKMDIEHQA